jgi:hypothetical protein
MLAKQCELAWASGFFEGEGHINVTPASKAKTHGYNSWTTQITMTQKGTEEGPPDVLERFANLFPGGKIYKEKGRDLWRYTVSKKRLVRSYLMSMLPWFGSRRANRAHECIQKIINSPYKY